MKTTARTALAAACASLLVATPAFAGAGDYHTKAAMARVKYADLELTTEEGQKKLQKRIDKAAGRVCRFDDRGQIQTPRAESKCFAETRKEVNIQVARLTGDNQLGG